MRLNRGTITLLVISLVVIGAVLVLNNNNQGTAPEPTTAASAAAGPLFPDINSEDVVSLEIRNTEDETVTRLTKDEADLWTVAEATNSTARGTDQTKAVGTMDIFATMRYTDSFTADSLETFGLDTPTYQVSMSTADDITMILQVGNTNPGESRYYVLRNNDNATVYLVNTFDLDRVLDLIDEPPYEPPPTATPTPLVEATVEVTPEVTAEAAQPETTPEVTAEAEAPEESVEATAEVTEAP
jgi:hypothetical protein